MLADPLSSDPALSMRPRLAEGATEGSCSVVDALLGLGMPPKGTCSRAAASGPSLDALL